jgi:hypothetical protein
MNAFSVSAQKRPYCRQLIMIIGLATGGECHANMHGPGRAAGAQRAVIIREHIH